MTIVEEIWSVNDLGPDCSGFREDTLTLTWEERQRGHGRRRSDSGLEFAISLPGGTILKSGDCMVLAAEKTVIKVQEAREPVYLVRPKTSQEWAYYAYHVGNRHQQIMIGESELVLLQSPSVRSLLEQLHADFEEDSRPFTAALVSVGHSI